jgi:hypothetical protein
MTRLRSDPRTARIMPAIAIHVPFNSPPLRSMRRRATQPRTMPAMAPLFILTRAE